MSETHPLRTLFMTALGGGTPPSSRLFAAAWHLASQTGDEHLQITLAEHPALPEEVRDLLAGLRSARVRVALLRRADLPVDVRAALLDGETRSSVLAFLAGDPNTDPSVLAELLGAASKSIYVAVATNAGAPVALRREAAIALLRRDRGGQTRWTLSDAETRDLWSFVNSDGAGHNAYAEHVSTYDLERFITSTHLSGAQLDRLVSYVLDSNVEYIGRARRGESRRNAAGALATKCSRLVDMANLTEDHLSRLAAACDLAEAELGGSDRKVQAIRARIDKARNGNLYAQLATARTSENAAELAALAADPDLDTVVRDLILHNRATDAVTTARAARGCTLDAAFLNARAGQLDVLAELWFENQSVMTDTWDPTAEEADFAVSLALDPRSAPTSANRLLERLARRGLLTVETVGEFDFTALLNSKNPSQVLLRLVAAAFDESLNSSDVDLDLLVSFSRNYSGPLDQLVPFAELLAFDPHATTPA